MNRYLIVYQEDGLVSLSTSEYANLVENVEIAETYGRVLAIIPIAPDVEIRRY